MSISLYILEDEEWLRKGIKKLIPWQKLGLSPAGESGSSQKAIPELLSCKPDIFLCDIKVPGRSGLEVIREVRPYLPDMACILISGYQDFSYARDAISLNVRNYLLKPVKADELEKTLSEAAAFVLETRKKKIDNKYAHNSFLVRSLENNVTDEEASILQEQEHISCYCVAVLYLPDTQASQSLTASLTDFADIHSVPGLHLDFYQKNSQEYGIIFSSSHEVPFRMQVLGFLNRLQDFLADKCNYFCCLGTTVHSLKNISDSYNKAKMAYLYRDIHAASHVILYDPDMVKAFCLPEPGLLEQLHLCLEAVDPESVKVLVESIFSRLESSSDITIQECIDYIFYLCFDVIRLLHHKGISSRKYYDRCYALLDSKEKLHSCLQLKEWTSSFITDVAEDLSALSQKAASTAVKRVKDYIDSHYIEEITLHGCAKMVSLNAAYLSSSFKKITGQNFSDYLMEKRLEKAEVLLTHTALGIAETAMMAGYENVRYFSKIFRKRYGTTPTEYRAKNTREDI